MIEEWENKEGKMERERRGREIYIKRGVKVRWRKSVRERKWDSKRIRGERGDCGREMWSVRRRENEAMGDRGEGYGERWKKRYKDKGCEIEGGRE